MKPQLKVIDCESGIQDLIIYLKDKEYIAFDTETTGLNKRDQVIGISICAEESIAYYIILQEWSVSDNVLNTTYLEDSVEVLLNNLKSKNLIAHNSVFDCMMIESNFGIKLIDSIHTDTLLAAHLVNENRRVGLKELGSTIFGESATDEAIKMKQSILDNGGKITKTSYELYKADAYLIGEYGAKDAWLTYKLFLELVPQLEEQGLTSFFYDEESMPLLKGPTYQLNTTGLQVDTKALLTLKNTLIAECAEAKTFIETEIKPYIIEKYPGTTKKNTFNFSSNMQLSWLLFNQLKLEFNTLTKEGKKVCKSLGLKLPYVRGQKNAFIQSCLTASGGAYQPEAIVNGKKVRAKKIAEPWKYIMVDKETLTKLAHKYKWIEVLLSYQRKIKILNTYVNGIEGKVSYGVIQPSFLQHGTSSGRYSSRTPNFQNLPRDDQRVKHCIVSRPGKTFVSADYSQLEPRIFAYYSKDEKLMNAFNGNTDFYSVVGIEVYDKFDALPIKDGHPDAFGTKYKKLRQDAKVFTLAKAYGANAFRLAPLLGKSVEDTQDIIDKYLESFPGVKSMMLEAHGLAKEKGFVTNLFGRPRRLPQAIYIPKDAEHDELPYEERSLLNLATNHRIQSTAASIINRAAIRFHSLIKEAQIDAVLILQVHDELVAECAVEDADNVATLLRYAMENTTVLEGMPLEAIPRVSNTLAK